MVSDLERRGGAARAAARLAEGLRRRGAEVRRFVLAPGGPPEDSGVERVDRSAPIWYRAAARAARTTGERGAAVAERVETARIARRLAERVDDWGPDVISLHNVHGAGWGAAEVAALEAVAPIVWTLHDMWSFTGRCAYSGECRRFLEGCDAACPTPEEYPALAPSRIGPAWRAKRDLLASDARIVAVTPSRWLAREARRGSWAGRRVEVIPNGVDLRALRPVDRARARAALGLPPEATVVAAMTDPASEGRKGESVLGRALAAIEDAGALALLVFGDGEPPVEDPPFPVREAGYLADEPALREALGAADLLAFPSLADNLPNVVLESLACGTPVLAFAVGGVPEAVREGETGWLVEAPTPAAMAARLEPLLASGPPEGIRERCRRVAEEEYDLELQGRRYLALFADVSGEGPE